MKILKNVVPAIIAFVFLVACSSQPNITPPPTANLSAAEKATLLTEALFASAYSRKEKAEQEGPEFISQPDYSYSVAFDEDYESAYQSAAGKEPIFITSKTTLTYAFSIKDGNFHTSLSVDGVSGLSGTIVVTVVCNPTTKAVSYTLDGTSFPATGFDPPDFEASLDLPTTYFIVQLLNPGTQTVVYEFPLEYNISNYPFCSESLEYRQIETIRNKKSYFDIFELLATDYARFPPPSNSTTTYIRIEDFDGIGTYDTIYYADFDWDLDPMISLRIETNQIENDNEYKYATIDACEKEGGVIVISRYDKIGGYVVGHVNLENATLKFYDTDYTCVDSESYDVMIRFSLTRGEDLQYYKTIIYLHYSEGFIITYELTTGEEYSMVFNESSMGDKSISGWSTEQNGTEAAYTVGSSIVVPEYDLHLYVIWAD